MEIIFNIINRALACKENEYCTNCPIRIGCSRREDFYCDTKEFIEERKQANIQVIAILISRGYSKEEAISKCAKMSDGIYKKRDRELEEHPIYSDK